MFLSDQIKVKHPNYEMPCKYYKHWDKVIHTLGIYHHERVLGKRSLRTFFIYVKKKIQLCICAYIFINAKTKLER